MLNFVTTGLVSRTESVGVLANIYPVQPSRRLITSFLRLSQPEKFDELNMIFDLGQGKIPDVSVDDSLSALSCPENSTPAMGIACFSI